MEKNFTEQDSLKVINEMIAQARNNYQKGAGTYCIFWGYFIAALALLNFILLHVFLNTDINPGYASYVWITTLPVAIIYFISIKNKGKRELVITHIDRLIYSIWIAFGVSCFLFLLILNLYSNMYEVRSVVFLITPIILLLTGLAQFATAVAVKFKLYYYAAYIFWFGSLLSILLLLLTKRGDVQFIVLALCMILGFCIPGHILNRKAEKNV